VNIFSLSYPWTQDKSIG